MPIRSPWCSARGRATHGHSPRGTSPFSRSGASTAAAARYLAGRALRGRALRPRDRALLARTDGNPLALVELPSTLSRDQLEGTPPLPGQLHLTDTVQRVFLDRCRRLPEQVQTLLLVAAADDSGSLSVVRRAARILGVDDPARSTPPSRPSSWSQTATASACGTRSSGLPSTRRPPVTNVGPPTGRSPRRWEPADDPDRQAWHWASSVEGPDPVLWTHLLGAASRAERRGGHAAASAAYERAAELTQTSRHAPSGCTTRSANAWEAGEPRDPNVAHCRLARAPRTGCCGRTSTGFEAASRCTSGSAVDAHRIFVDAARAVAADDPETGP